MYEISTGKTKLGHAKKASTAIAKAKSAASWRKKAVTITKAGKVVKTCKKSKRDGKVHCTGRLARRRRVIKVGRHAGRYA